MADGPSVTCGAVFDGLPLEDLNLVMLTWRAHASEALSAIRENSLKYSDVLVVAILRRDGTEDFSIYRRDAAELREVLDDLTSHVVNPNITPDSILLDAQRTPPHMLSVLMVSQRGDCLVMALLALDPRPIPITNPGALLN